MLSMHRITNYWHGPAGLQAGIKKVLYVKPVKILNLDFSKKKKERG